LGTDNPKAILAYWTVAIVWGSTYLGLRTCALHMPPLLAGGIRYTIAGLILVILILVKKQSWPSQVRHVKNAAAQGICFFLFSNGLLIWSLQYLEAGVSSLLVTTTPIFTALLDSCLPNGLKLSRKGWIGMLISCFGVFLICRPSLVAGAVSIKGLIGLFTSALIWGVSSLLAARTPTSGSLWSNIAIQHLSGGIALLVVSKLLYGSLRFDADWAVIGSLLYLILFGSIVGYSAFMYLMHHMAPAKAMTYTYINPLVPITLGGIFLGEHISSGMIIGGIVTLLGVVLVQSARTYHTKQAALHRRVV